MVDTVKVVLTPTKDIQGKTHQALNMSSRQFNKLVRALMSAEPGTVFSGSVGDLQIAIFRRSPLLAAVKEADTAASSTQYIRAGSPTQEVVAKRH